MDSRANARMAANFWIAVDGVDDTPLMRLGDISLTGAYFPIIEHVGDVGSTLFVQLGSPGWEASVQVLAKIIRVATLDDLVGGHVPIGVAVEFLPETKQALEAIRQVVWHVVDRECLRRPEAAVIQEEISAEIEHGGEVEDLGELAVEAVALRTSTALAVGEHLRIDVARPATRERLSLKAKVTAVTERQGAFDVTVSIEAADSNPMAARAEVADTACRQILADVASTAELETGPEDQMNGTLSPRLCLPNLLSFLSMEETSGALTLTQSDRFIRVYLRDGQVIDATSDRPDEAPRDALVRALRWEEGVFRLSSFRDDRRDRFDCNMTILLLDLSSAQERSPVR